MDRNEKKRELKRKNAIAILCKRWGKEGINTSFCDFLDIVRKERLLREIINKLDEMDTDNKSLVYEKNKDIVSLYIHRLVEIIRDEESYVFFINVLADNEAFIIQGKNLKMKIDFLIRESGYPSKTCSILCCSQAMDKGWCLWSGEYDSRIYLW